MNIKDIIWDFDGTLFDTYPVTVDAFKKALKDSNIEETQENILNYLKISASHAIRYFKELYRLDDTFIERFNAYEKAIKPETAKPFPFAEEACKKVMEIGGRNFIFTHRGKSTLKYLENYGMTSYFTEIITKHNGFKRKPDPEAFIYLIEKYKLDKITTMVIGDRDFEILGGKSSGIKTCLYNTNNIKPSVEPDFYIESLENLSYILK